MSIATDTDRARIVRLKDRQGNYRDGAFAAAWALAEVISEEHAGVTEALVSEWLGRKAGVPPDTDFPPPEYDNVESEGDIRDLAERLRQWAVNTGRLQDKRR